MNNYEKSLHAIALIEEVFQEAAKRNLRVTIRFTEECVFTITIVEDYGMKAKLQQELTAFNLDSAFFEMAKKLTNSDNMEIQYWESHETDEIRNHFCIQFDNAVYLFKKKIMAL